MTYRLRSWFAAALLLHGCTSPRPFHPFPTSTALDPGGGALDVAWADDFALVDVRIDGRPAGRFLLDTGASAMLIAPEVVDALGLERVTFEGGFALRGADASEGRIERAVGIRELRCGPLAVRGFDAMEADMTPFTRTLGRQVDGVLPATAFHDVLLTIDYPARSVALAEADPPAADATNTMALLPGSLPQVTLRVGDTGVTMLLDSGSTQFLTLPEAVLAPRRGAPVETGKQRTIGGVVAVRQVRVDARLDLGGHALVDPIVELGRDSRGAIGAALLRRFRVELDQHHGRVRFDRATDEAVPSPPVRGIGLGFLRETTQWTVAYVLDGTPGAAAGVAVGEQVTAVDGVAVGELSRTHFDLLLAERDALRLTVRADGGTRDVLVPVAVLVP